MVDNEFYLLSKYRTKLMGLAMLLIMIFHTSIELSEIPFIESIKNIGDIGVDIFFLLSGMGLYFSYFKNNNKNHFYKNRIRRIIPTFLPVAIVWYTSFTIVFKGSFLDILLGVTTLGFWLDKNFNWWFISVILVLYLITPYYIDWIKNKPRQCTLIIVILSIIVGLIIRFSYLDKRLDYLLIFINRIPIFIIGIYLGYVLLDTSNTKNIKLTSIYIFSIIGFIISILIVNPDIIYIPFALKYYAYIPLSVGVCIFFANLFNITKNIIINYIFTFLGTYSLEIYLFHEKILWLLSYTKKFIIFDKYNIIINIVAVLLTVLISYTWKNIINKYVILKNNRVMKRAY